MGSRFKLHLRPLANLATMSTLTVHCRWEDKMAREKTGCPSSYAEVIEVGERIKGETENWTAEAKKMKSVYGIYHNIHLLLW